MWERGVASRKYRTWIWLFLLWAMAPEIPGPLAARASDKVETLSELSLEELMSVDVASMGFFSIPQDKAPGSVFVLEEQDLERLPARTLKDMFQLSVPGVQMGTFNRGSGNLYMPRGAMLTDNSTSQFLWDGTGMNSAAGYGVTNSLSSMLIGDISRIEISHSPNSSVLGNGSVNGMVNLVPKTGASHPGPSASAAFGLEDQSLKAEAGYGLVYGPGKDLYLYAGWERAQGAMPDDDLGYKEITGATGLPSGYRSDARQPPNYRISAKINHGPLSFSGYFQREAYGADDPTFYPYIGEYYADNYLAALVMKPALSLDLSKAESLDISFPMGFFDAGRIDHYTQGREGDEEKGNSEKRLAAQLTLKTRRWENHKTAVGFKAGLAHFRNDRYYFRADPDEPSFYADNSADWSEYSVFAEDIFQITSKWTLTAGLRMDAIQYEFLDRGDYYADFKTNQEIWSPRFASALELWDHSVFKVSFQQGFHFPRVTSIWVEKFEPEIVQSYEAGFVQAFPGLGLKLTLNGFYNIFQDSLVSEFWGALENRQREDIATLGGEFMVEWKGPSDTLIRLSYAYSRPKDLSDGKAVSGVANEELDAWYCYSAHTVKALLSKYWMDRRLMTSVAAEYGSALEYPDLYQSRKLFNQDRYRVSAKAAWAVTDRLSLDLVVENIAGSHIPVPSYVGRRAWYGNFGATDKRISFNLTWH